MAENKGNNQQALGALLGALNSGGAEDREQALDALEGLGQSGISDILADGLDEKDPELRVRAANALGNLGSRARAAVPVRPAVRACI